MAQIKLTDEQIDEGFVKPFAAIANYAIQHTGTNIDNKVIEKLKKALNDINPDHPQTEKDLAKNVLLVLNTITSLTENQTDDKIVHAAEVIFNLVSGEKGAFASFIELIKIKHQAKKVAAEEAKKAAQDVSNEAAK